jgi:hypothetical protein
MVASAFVAFPGVGLDRLRFGMNEQETRAALAPFGVVEDATAPGGALKLRTVGLDPSFSVYASFTSDGLLFSLEAWRPDDVGAVDILLSGVPIFGHGADAVLDELAQTGLELDRSDKYYPVAPTGYVAFDREGGDDCDDDGVARVIQSMLLAPSDYMTSYTSTRFGVV